jgi:hypothetical protein
VARHFDGLTEEAKAVLLRFKPDSLALLKKRQNSVCKKQKAGYLSSIVRGAISPAPGLQAF